MDPNGFLYLLDRLVKVATDDPRRFAYVRPDTGTTAHVVFAPPNEINTLEAYFERAVEDYKRQRELQYGERRRWRTTSNSPT